MRQSGSRELLKTYSCSRAPTPVSTPEQASAAALAQVPGTVKKVELENEDGNVVYGVEIKTANGESDVKVDAGDGRVLHVEKDGEDN